MHIVLDARTATDHFPGIGRYVFNLARAMAPLLQSDEQLIMLYDPTQTSPWNLPSLAGAQTRLVEIPVSPFSLRQQWLIPRLLRQLKADVFHSPYYLMPYRLPIPTLLTVYDLIPLRYPDFFSWSTRQIFRWATALALHTAAHITTISQATRSDLLTYYHPHPAKITPIHLAADPNFSPQPPEVVTVLCERLNLPEQYILYIGSNKPHKNLVRLIEAWAIVNRQSSTPSLRSGASVVNCQLIIAGVWDARYPQAKTRVKELGLGATVRFLGPVAEADLPALYSGAIAFVFPSEYEGFGLPVLEAMACAAPVACANTSSLPEVAGPAALYFDPLNVTDLAGALNGLLGNKDLQAQLRPQGLHQAAQFSWERAAAQTLALYREMI